MQLECFLVDIKSSTSTTSDCPHSTDNRFNHSSLSNIGTADVLGPGNRHASWVQRSPHQVSDSQSRDWIIAILRNVATEGSETGDQTNVRKPFLCVNSYVLVFNMSLSPCVFRDCSSTELLCAVLYPWSVFCGTLCATSTLLFHVCLAPLIFIRVLRAFFPRCSKGLEFHKTREFLLLMTTTK